MASLRASFDIVEINGATVPDSAARIVQQLGDGVGVIDQQGDLVWADERLNALSPQVRDAFTEQAAAAMVGFNDANARSRAWHQRENRKAGFTIGKQFFEVVLAPAAADDGGTVTATVGVIWETTTAHDRQKRIRNIDMAGAELLNIEPTSLEGKTIADRLKLLEDKIVKSVHDLLHFDNFEVRLLDDESNRLELVISVGLTPLKIGEVMYAEEHDNGISGYVAATGRPYICHDVASDPMYTEGLIGAGSSLTVPLRLQDEVIGVFNIESYTPHQFDDNDLLYAELFARYIAAAINILDLLVVERYTTNEQVARNVINELTEPLADITARAIALQATGRLDAENTPALEGIIHSAEIMRQRIEACTSGPRSILGTEQVMDEPPISPADLQADPIAGKRILVADDEPMIRDTMAEILKRRGGIVAVCRDGAEAITTVQSDDATSEPFDLVISDIRMPGNTGYEVFRATKSISQQTEVILMTGFGYDPHHSIVRASQEGLHSFLFKPFKANQMLEAVRGALKTA